MTARSKDFRTIVIALVAGLIGANAPAIAHGVRHALFAHNADKVDGIHAAPATKPFAKRKGKLVATDKTTGLLPGDIIPAVDAETVDGKNASDFADAAHNHDAQYADTNHSHAGEDIVRGIVDQAYIDSAVARDSEVPQAGTGLSSSEGFFNVDTSTIQARLSSSCSAGQFLQGIGVTGTPSCAAPAGDITEVSTGSPSVTGLTGGVTSGIAFLSIDFNTVQRRISTSCSAGSSIRAVDASGNLTCETDDNSGGDITEVIAGTGLQGGGNSGTLTINATYGGSGGDFGSANTLARSDHVHEARYLQQNPTSAESGSVWVDGTIRTSGLLRVGSETGTTEAPAAPLGVVVRSIKSTNSTDGNIVALGPGGSAVRRDGTLGGLKFTHGMGESAACIGMASDGSLVGAHVHNTQPSPSTLFTDAQNIVYVSCSFGEPAGASTQLVMKRLLGAGPWSGSIISGVNQ